MTLWDENADSAFEEGRQSILQGVYVLVSWEDGEDLQVQVFEDKRTADPVALTIAQRIWDQFVEDDWPIQPETWGEIFQEVLNRSNCQDTLEMRIKEIQT